MISFIKKVPYKTQWIFLGEAEKRSEEGAVKVQGAWRKCIIIITITSTLPSCGTTLTEVESIVLFRDGVPIFTSCGSFPLVPSLHPRLLLTMAFALKASSARFYSSSLATWSNQVSVFIVCWLLGILHLQKMSFLFLSNLELYWIGSSLETALILLEICFY